MVASLPLRPRGYSRVVPPPEAGGPLQTSHARPPRFLASLNLIVTQFFVH